jgi:Lon protease-like protein
LASNPFHPKLSDLPAVLPVFPLPGVILLPWAQLPLNIFEPRYLNMTLDALGAGRLIGMVQPDTARAGSDALCHVGCAGRITAFTETEDGRLLVVLTGVCRFEVGEEHALWRGYRRVTPLWRPYAGDLKEPGVSGTRTRPLLEAVGLYAAARDLQVDQKALARLSPEDLVRALAMNLPFDPAEKQALLEMPTPEDRGAMLLTLMGLKDPLSGGPTSVWH